MANRVLGRFLGLIYDLCLAKYHPKSTPDGTAATAAEAGVSRCSSIAAMAKG